MKLKHWQGYGIVNAERIKDKSCELHVKVSGNHEWGVETRYDDHAYNWLYKRFKRNAPTYWDWRMNGGTIVTISGWDGEKKEETCDYIFKKEEL